MSGSLVSEWVSFVSRVLLDWRYLTMRLIKFNFVHGPLGWRSNVAESRQPTFSSRPTYIRGPLPQKIVKSSEKISPFSRYSPFFSLRMVQIVIITELVILIVVIWPRYKYCYFFRTEHARMFVQVGEAADQTPCENHAQRYIMPRVRIRGNVLFFFLSLFFRIFDVHSVNFNWPREHKISISFPQIQKRENI